MAGKPDLAEFPAPVSCPQIASAEPADGQKRGIRLDRRRPRFRPLRCLRRTVTQHCPSKRESMSRSSTRLLVRTLSLVDPFNGG